MNLGKYFVQRVVLGAVVALGTLLVLWFSQFRVESPLLVVFLMSLVAPALVHVIWTKPTFDTNYFIRLILAAVFAAIGSNALHDLLGLGTAMNWIVVGVNYFLIVLLLDLRDLAAAEARDLVLHAA